MDFAYDGWLIECTDELAKRGTKSAVREITIHPEEFSDWSRTSGQNPSLAMLGTFALAKSRGKE